MKNKKRSILLSALVGGPVAFDSALAGIEDVSAWSTFCSTEVGNNFVQSAELFRSCPIELLVL